MDANSEIWTDEDQREFERVLLQAKGKPNQQISNDIQTHAELNARKVHKRLVNAGLRITGLPALMS